MPPAIFIDSLVLSSMYILMASGLVLVFSIMGILNFAHGQFYMLGAYAIFYLFQQAGINFFISLALSAAIVGFVGILIERYIMRPIGQPIQAVVVTIALISVFEGLITLIAGPAPHSVTSAFPGNVDIFGVSLSSERLATVVIAVILIIAL
jgi:branched-chain amino acid transport system permease protein